MQIDLERFEELVAQKYINKRKHPEADLILFDYSNHAQFDKMWTPETIMARGLITDLDGNIVSRPFKKFFNLQEHLVDNELPVEPFEVTEKLDGSMGLLYYVDGKPFISTRGSFESSQAIHATKVFREKYSDVKLDPNLSYVFEIIYPSNRIVVNYGDVDDLFLLAGLDTETGIDVPINISEFRRPKVFTSETVHELLEHKVDDFEGYVVRFVHSNLRVKVKLEEYLRIHRIVTGVNSKNLWEALSAGDDINIYLDKVPDEFYTWVKTKVDDFLTDFELIKSQAYTVYEQWKHLDKKDYAEQVKRLSFASVCFAIYDQKPIDKMIWKMVKPEHAESPFKDTE